MQDRTISRINADLHYLHLSILDLSDNSLGSPGVGSIADAVENNHRLISLSVDGNGAETRYLYQIGEFIIPQVVCSFYVRPFNDYNGADRILRRNKAIHVEHLKRNSFETQDQFWTKRAGTWHGLVRTLDGDALRSLGGRNYPPFYTLEEKDNLCQYRGREDFDQETGTSQKASIDETVSKGFEPERTNILSRIQQRFLEEDCRGLSKEDSSFPKGPASESGKKSIGQHTRVHETRICEEKKAKVPCYSEILSEPSSSITRPRCASPSKEILKPGKGLRKLKRDSAENQQIQEIGYFFDDFLKRAGVLSSGLEHVNAYLQKAMDSTESVHVRKS